MAKRAIRITLLEPVVASHNAATATAPSTLPFLPGAMLWGLLASRAYVSMSADKVLDGFYGGGLVIDDALLSTGGSVALPAPMSLHRLKDQSTPSGWKDWSDGSHEPGYSQAKDRQIAPGSTTSNLVELRPRTFDTQRTAINPDTLRASDGQFFGIQALAEGQVFIGQISGPDDLVDAVIKDLDGKEHVLGKSRSAEFGRVRIEAIDPPPLPVAGKGTGVVIWCLSDLAAHDKYHQPTERPDSGFFGTGIEVDWSKSFVRHRSYSPFNAKWQARQPERLVISRGSVIVLKSPLPCGEARFGLYQEQGLGRVLVSDMAPLDLLTSWAPTSTGNDMSSVKGAAESALAKWLRARTDRQGDGLILVPANAPGKDDLAKHFLPDADGILTRDHVRLNDKGVVDGAGKFTRVAVPAGARFTFHIQTGNRELAERLESLVKAGLWLGGARPCLANTNVYGVVHQGVAPTRRGDLPA